MPTREIAENIVNAVISLELAERSHEGSEKTSRTIDSIKGMDNLTKKFLRQYADTFSGSVHWDTVYEWMETWLDDRSGWMDQVCSNNRHVGLTVAWVMNRIEEGPK